MSKEYEVEILIPTIITVKCDGSKKGLSRAIHSKLKGVKHTLISTRSANETK